MLYLEGKPIVIVIFNYTDWLYFVLEGLICVLENTNVFHI